jgi:cell wall-associated NlpC family hydrolase
MKNRTELSPILGAIVLSLVASSALGAQADQASNSAAPAILDPVQAAAPEPVATTPAAPAPATSTPVTPSATTLPAPKHTMAYTVVAGDSLTSLARKFNSTRKKLKALNNLASSTIKPGQVILVPSTRSALAAKTAKAKPHHTYLVAQPVQDFDIPASTFASCPVPLASPDEDTVSGDSSTTPDTEKPAPVAKLVSPAEMAADEEKQRLAAEAVTPRVTPTEPAPSGLAHASAQPHTAPVADSTFAAPANASKPNLITRILHSLSGQGSASANAATDWGNRFLQQARALANEGIDYDDEWRPPGESHRWTMDCSNTTRYLYRVTAGIELPRTASDQYYYLHLQGKAWDVPQTASGFADTEFLRQNLKPGDLLFWENTYRPERQPPITHVMVYLGTNQRGEWLMAGSQCSRGGEHNRRNGGPDVYVFHPCQPCGGYTTWLGLVHHQGRFCAFGRPLEADRSKLAVAEDN